MLPTSFHHLSWGPRIYIGLLKYRVANQNLQHRSSVFDYTSKRCDCCELLINIGAITWRYLPSEEGKETGEVVSQNKGKMLKKP